MTQEDEGVLAVYDWLCPVCNTGRNSQGWPFSGCTAVALHVAGKARTGDRTHKSWALTKVGTTIDEPPINRSINTLADALMRAVAEDNMIRRELEDQKIRRWIEEKAAAKEPRVLAYRLIGELETTLHQFVRCTLQESLGEDENGWWVKGIPLQIRSECARRREEDPHREELYRYTDLIDLKTIIDKNWRVFEPHLRFVGQHVQSKGHFLESIAQLNDVRKRVMHPIRMTVSDEDLSFLRGLRDFVRGLGSTKP